MPKEGPQAPPIPQEAQAPQALQAPLVTLQKSEDAEAHLLRTSDWKDTHKFQEDDKVQRFCLRLIGGARLWYKSLRPINVD